MSKVFYLASLPILASMAITANAKESTTVSSDYIEKQRIELLNNTNGKGFGPQSPRDIDSLTGTNKRVFSSAPDYKAMNLCNIHFHKNAEHKGGEFVTYAGNGDGEGSGTGYVYSGELSKREKKPLSKGVCASSDHGSLQSGDTIELHYVHSTADITPGPTLGACLSESIMNPQLRVETQVFVLVNDRNAIDFKKITEVEKVNEYFQAINIPTNTGDPIQYAGSTTGPSYNEKGSPLQVSWSVRPKVAKVDINTMDAWCDENIFDEDHAHGVRNLVIDPELLSEIK